MKYIKKNGVPRAMLKSLAGDIAKLINSNEGGLSILEIVEDIPYDIRSDVIEGLSSFYDQCMVGFFQLIKMEYGREFETVCDRVLNKYRLAGLEFQFPPVEKKDFFRAFATISRHTGRMTIDVAWRKPNDHLYVECFFLAFSADGVHSFFVVDDMPVDRYEFDREKQADMIEINYFETCLLVRDAYDFNIRCMNRPALGKFLYQGYLDGEMDISDADINRTLRKLSAGLSPRQLGNTFFHALRRQDLNYVFSILDQDSISTWLLLEKINQIMIPGSLLLEGQIDEIKGSQKSLSASAHAIILFEREVCLNNYTFYLTKDGENSWWITNLEQIGSHTLERDSNMNPFSVQVHCRVYEILDVDDLFDLLDRVDDIREVEELPYGMHMRVTTFEDDFNHGVTFMTGVVADLIINGDEFVVISQQNATIEDFHNLFTLDQNGPLIPRGEYELSLTSAYSYLSGQYLQFEDILLNDAEDLAFEDGMRFISARYALKDRNKVQARLEELAICQIDVPGVYSVFYQFDDLDYQTGFMAEFVLGCNWVTVSAYGDREIGLARQRFEENMYDSLEFDGLEIREEGIFGILTPEVKKMYPLWEDKLKKLYLNKWYDSHLPNLSGMSPSEASKTEEGTRMLWTMFKRIKQKDQQRRMRGEPRQVRLKEYINKISKPKEGEI